MTTQATTVSLVDVLAYRHPGVIRRYAKEHGASPAEAEELFHEMLKWLYLAYRSTTDAEGSAGCAMNAEIEKIDHMWHTFLLFTHDYAAFCQRYFGFFLHHIPQEDAEDERPFNADLVRRQFERQYGLIYDVLGEQTLLAWYDECRYAAVQQGQVGVEEDQETKRKLMQNTEEDIQGKLTTLDAEEARICKRAENRRKEVEEDNQRLVKIREERNRLKLMKLLNVEGGVQMRTPYPARHKNAEFNDKRGTLRKVNRTRAEVDCDGQSYSIPLISLLPSGGTARPSHLP